MKEKKSNQKIRKNEIKTKKPKIQIKINQSERRPPAKKKTKNKKKNG